MANYVPPNYLQLQLLRGNGDSVEVTEPHGLLQLGMVARRTDEGKAVFQLSPGNLWAYISLVVDILFNRWELQTEVSPVVRSPSD